MSGQLLNSSKQLPLEPLIFLFACKKLLSILKVDNCLKQVINLKKQWEIYDFDVIPR